MDLQEPVPSASQAAEQVCRCFRGRNLAGTGILRIETFRSGGPGGQHQNTTDSGVRITHLSSGLAASSTDERSQHRNRQAALNRLKLLFLLKQEESLADGRSVQNRLHRQLERGNPVRVFKGKGFAEVARN